MWKEIKEEWATYSWARKWTCILTFAQLPVTFFVLWRVIAISIS